MKHNGQFIDYERMGRKLHQMLGLGYECEVQIETIDGSGIMYFYRENTTTIAIPFTDFNTFDEVEIEFNELGTIKRLYK